MGRASLCYTPEVSTTPRDDTPSSLGVVETSKEDKKTVQIVREEVPILPSTDDTSTAPPRPPATTFKERRAARLAGGQSASSKGTSRDVGVSSPGSSSGNYVAKVITSSAGAETTAQSVRHKNFEGKIIPSVDGELAALTKRSNTPRASTPSPRTIKIVGKTEAPGIVKSEKTSPSFTSKPSHETDDFGGNPASADSGWKHIPISTFLTDDPLTGKASSQGKTSTSPRRNTVAAGGGGGEGANKMSVSRLRVLEQHENSQKEGKGVGKAGVVLAPADHVVRRIPRREGGSSRRSRSPLAKQAGKVSPPQRGTEADDPDPDSTAESDRWPEPAPTRTTMGGGLTPLRMEISPRLLRNSSEDRLHLREKRKYRKNLPTQSSDSERGLLSSTTSGRGLSAPSLSGSEEQSTSQEVVRAVPRALGSLREHRDQIAGADQGRSDTSDESNVPRFGQQEERFGGQNRGEGTPRTPRGGADLDPHVIAARRLAGRPVSPRFRNAAESGRNLLAEQYAEAGLYREVLEGKSSPRHSHDLRENEQTLQAHRYGGDALCTTRQENKLFSCLVVHNIQHEWSIHLHGETPASAE